MSETQWKRGAVFLDRDGTIAEEKGYVNHIDRFQVYPFAAGAIRQLNRAEIPVIVVTNQSGIARNIFPESLVHRVHKKMIAQLAAEGAWIDAVYFCPHKLEDACECRKPNPGMLQRAAREHGLDLTTSWMVGDRYADLELGFATHGRGILVMTGYGRGEYEWHRSAWPRQPDALADNLSDAVRHILLNGVRAARHDA